MSLAPLSLIPPGELAELKKLCESTPDGAIVEVGVYRGGSAAVLAKAAGNRTLHLFDTFEGMPVCDEGDLYAVGAFNNTSETYVRTCIPEAKIYKGIFPDTLPDDLQNIAFVHMDADNYMPTYEGIRRLWPRMVDGGIMAFDDSNTIDAINRALNANADILPDVAYRTPLKMLFLVKNGVPNEILKR